MEFRVTVGLGQDSVDPEVLDERAAAVQRCVPPGAVVVVDVVKAAIQLVLPVHVDDALEAAQQALQISDRGLRDGGLNRPDTIIVLEAEAVVASVADENLRPHPAPLTR